MRKIEVYVYGVFGVIPFVAYVVQKYWTVSMFHNSCHKYYYQNTEYQLKDSYNCYLQ